MRSKNFGVCHGCRSTEHFFWDCPVKRKCPWCHQGWEKCFEVERSTKHKGKLFKTCSNNCGYFEWVGTEEAGESSTRNEVMKMKPPAIDEVDEELPNMFDNLARIAEKRDIEVSLNITFRKRSAEVNGKDGKSKA